MIGAGLFLSLVSTVIHTVVTAVEYFSEQSQNFTMPDTPQVSLYWILVVEYLNGIGAVVTTVFGIEFAMAQTPNRMRALENHGTGDSYGWLTRHGGDFITKIFHVFKVSHKVHVLLLPSATSTDNANADNICYCCQAIQVQREGEARQHTGHSGGTLREIL